MGSFLNDINKILFMSIIAMFCGLFLFAACSPSRMKKGYGNTAEEKG